MHEVMARRPIAVIINISMNGSVDQLARSGSPRLPDGVRIALPRSMGQPRGVSMRPAPPNRRTSAAATQPPPSAAIPGGKARAERSARVPDELGVRVPLVFPENLRITYCAF